jgi:hypothetical protein
MKGLEMIRGELNCLGRGLIDSPPFEVFSR